MRQIAVDIIPYGHYRAQRLTSLFWAPLLWPILFPSLFDQASGELPAYSGVQVNHIPAETQPAYKHRRQGHADDKKRFSLNSLIRR